MLLQSIKKGLFCCILKLQKCDIQDPFHTQENLLSKHNYLTKNKAHQLLCQNGHVRHCCSNQCTISCRLIWVFMSLCCYFISIVIIWFCYNKWLDIVVLGSLELYIIPVTMDLILSSLGFWSRLKETYNTCTMPSNSLVTFYLHPHCSNEFFVDVYFYFLEELGRALKEYQMWFVKVSPLDQVETNLANLKDRHIQLKSKNNL
jgi:hypothetical protein